MRCDGELELLDGDRVVARGSDELRLDRPELWWPNGLGEQRLYTLRAGGRELAIGFRTIELDGYRLTVNGEPTQIRGWNWVPLDALYGVPRPAKLAHLLAARGAGEREPAARLGRRADRDDRVLRRTATGSGCSCGRSSRSRAPGSRACPPPTPSSSS